jgi:hypothetical protein
MNKLFSSVKGIFSCGSSRSQVEKEHYNTCDLSKPVASDRSRDELAKKDSAKLSECSTISSSCGNEKHANPQNEQQPFYTLPTISETEENFVFNHGKSSSLATPLESTRRSSVQLQK